MRARHLLVLAVGVGVWGCRPAADQSQNTRTGDTGIAAPAPVAEAPQAATRPVDPADAAASAQALARQAENYAKEMEKVAATRPAVTTPANAPVIVDVPPVVTEPTAPAVVSPPVETAPAPATQPAVAVAVATPVAPAPVAPAPVAAAPTTDVLERRLRQRMKENPLDTAAHLDYQMLLLLRGAQVPEMESLAPLPAEDRETLTAVMDCLSNFRVTAASPDNLLLTKKVRPILELADRVRARADLSIPTVALCSAVQGFGNYEPMSGTFPAGGEVRTIVYCEVENFSARLGDGGMYETRLAQSMTLYDEGGRTVWQDPQRPVVDRARAKRRDFFVPRIVRLPAALAPGRYTLKVTIVDQAAQRLAEGTVPVTLAAGAAR